MAANPLAARVRRMGFPWRPPTVPVRVDTPDPGPALGADYETDWARSPVARAARAGLVHAVMWPMVSVLGSPERHGTDRLEGLDGPVVFASNHHSHVDTPVLLTSIPSRFRKKIVVGAAADYFFGTRVTSALSALVIGAIPIERNKIGRKSADLARSLIDDGWNLLIFPEGGRSPDGWGQPFRGGAAFIAMRAGVPVVPVHLEGTGRVLAKGGSLQRAKVTVTFGAPLRPAPGEDARKYAVRIEAAVAALADEALTDWWSARRRAYGNRSPSLGGPDACAWRRAWLASAKDKAVSRRRRAWPEI